MTCSSLTMLFCGYRQSAALEGGAQGVPGQAGALDAHGELGDARENGELAECRGVFLRLLLTRHQPMEALEKRLRFRPRLPLQARRHHRGRGLRDRAARALEADLPDHVSLEANVHRDLVPAERVVALRAAVRPLQDLEVTRPLIVIQDHLLVKLA